MSEKSFDKIYKYKNALIVKDKDNKCWLLKPGDYIGKLSKNKLTKICTCILE